jgi:RNA-directed DNA polymerase
MPLRHDFTLLKTRAHLVRVLGLDDAAFDGVLNFEPPPDPPPTKKVEFELEPGKFVVLEVSTLGTPVFFRHKIPKKVKARGYRIAWEPSHLKNDYKALARWLTEFLTCKLPGFPHPASYGYVSGRNIKENARAHCGHARLLTADIADFFGSISAGRIEKLFQQTGCTAEVSNLLSRFVTIEGALPLGLPTSPLLSNAVFLAADIALQALAERCGATYTRYSDDLSFSSDADLPDLEAVTAILANFGFTVATAKTHWSQRGQAHFVTGLSISEPDQPHVPRAKKHALRQELYYARKFGLVDHLTRRGVNDDDVLQEEINRLDGTVKFVAFHEPRLSGRIKPQWNEILAAAEKRASYAPRNQRGAPFYIAIDEAEFQSPDGPVLALALAVSQHQDRIQAATAEVLDDWLSDVHADGNREAIAARGLHYANATQDLRLSYVKRLQALPFEGYVVMGRITSPDRYEATYLRLLGAVIRRRLMAAEGRFAMLTVEMNSKVSQEKVRELVRTVHRDLDAEKNRRPRRALVWFVGKPDPEVSVPDFLLGVLGRYLQTPERAAGKPAPREHQLFERIRDKYRLILDADGWIEYSRRRPIAPWPPKPITLMPDAS